MPDFDPLETSPADFDTSKNPEVVAGIATPEPEEEEPTPSSAPEPEAEEPEAKPEEEPDAEEPPADGSDLEPDEVLKELGFPALPPELAENPDFVKRYHEQQFGMHKVLKAQQNVLEGLRKYDEVAQKLENPATSVEAFRGMAEIVKQQTGIDIIAQLSSKAEPAKQIDVPDDWRDFTPEQYAEAMELGCEYPSEYLPAKRMEERILRKLAPYEEERTQAKAQSETQNFLAVEAPRTITFLAKTENGWQVTNDMVAAALKQFPDLKDDLPRAVKRAYPDEFAAHHKAAAIKALGQEGPEMLTKGGSASKGTVLEELDVDAPSADLIHKIAKNQQALKARA